MAIQVADISLVRKQVLELLLASPRASRYTDAVGQNSDFPVLQELSDKILITDQTICLDISATRGHPYATKFLTAFSSEFDNGDRVTEHLGAYGDIWVKVDGVYAIGRIAHSRGDVLAMVYNRNLYGGQSRDCIIEGDFIYHNGDKAKVYLPDFTKTTACQTPQQYEDILIYGTVQLAEKLDSDDPFFKKFNDLFLLGRQMIKDKSEFIPTQEKMEALIGRAA